eukprot:1523264-Rhodomonas_salina.2
MANTVRLGLLESLHCEHFSDAYMARLRKMHAPTAGMSAASLSTSCSVGLAQREGEVVPTGGQRTRITRMAQRPHRLPAERMTALTL